MLVSTMWKIFAAVCFAVGIISGLGEWVFHWWREPGDWLAPLSIVLGFVGILLSASARQAERLRGSQDDHFSEAQRLQARLVEGQERLVQGQERLVQGQERLLAGQEEQTRLLREVVDSFRSRVQG